MHLAENKYNQISVKDVIVMSDWAVPERPYAVFYVDEEKTNFEELARDSVLDRVIMESVKFEMELEQMIRLGMISSSELEQRTYQQGI